MAVVAATHACQACGGRLAVEALAVNQSGVPDGQLRLHDITAALVLTCTGCGETTPMPQEVPVLSPTPPLPPLPTRTLCAGCDVREPFEHRCEGGLNCRCPECREADRLWGEVGVTCPCGNAEELFD